MVKAGEQSAHCGRVGRMADHFERFALVQAKFSSALVYPAFVAAVGVGIIIFFMTYMLPKFLTLFGNMEMQLPMMTQVLVKVSNVFTGYWWLMLLILIAGYILFKRFQATEDGKRKIDQWKMSAPVFGKVMKLNLYGQFARTLSTLLENGVPVLTALKITEQVLPNRVIRRPFPKRDAVTDERRWPVAAAPQLGWTWSIGEKRAM
jgi:type II secretory pathway component PulF